jgi:probable addiction module antidote protein
VGYNKNMKNQEYEVSTYETLDGRVPSSWRRDIGRIAGGGMMPRSQNYQDNLLEALKDPEEAAAYLSAALEDGNEQVFLLAVRNVVDATSGMTELANRTQLNRESLYKMLSERGNPQLSSIRAILEELGYRLTVEVVPATKDADASTLTLSQI